MDDRNAAKIIRILEKIANNLSGIKDELKKIRESQNQQDEDKPWTNHAF